MSGRVQVGVVGSGARGRHLVEQLYTIRDQEYFLCDQGQYGSFPLQEYDLYGTETPEWVEDIRGLQPSIGAIFDPSDDALEKADAICREHADSPSLYTEFEEFLDSPEYDAVIVTSPNDTHIEITTTLLERGIDVFCEKPVANTLEEHDELADLEASSSGRCFVGFNLRSSPVYTQFKELIANGRIGDLGMISAQNVREPFPTGFRYSKDRSGGTILEKNCHDFDLFNWYTESDPTRVTAFGGAHVFSENTDVTDHASIVVEYENDVKATLELCLYAPFTHGRHRGYSIRGSDGIALSPLTSSTIELFTYDDRTEFSPGERSGHIGGHGGADLHTLKRFVEWLYGEAERPATITDAKKAAAVAIAAQTAIVDGDVVSITPEYTLESSR